MKLPKELETNNELKNMPIGVSGYIVCWGMWVDSEGNCFMNENYTYGEKGGTQQLRITKVEGGYIAHVHEMSEPYTWSRESGPAYFGSPSDVCFGKVVGFGTKKECKPKFNFKDIHKN